LKRKEREANTDTDGPVRTGRRTAIMVGVAVVCIALVAGFGWRQFNKRAERPIEIVKTHAIPGTDVTIGEGINNFVADKGIKVVTTGFKPSWGAEETSKDVWVVSYVFEVGRQSHWVSWKVYPKSGNVIPRDALARELWGNE
jgi:hypothetical protein